jgi:hypothetical protein
MKSKPGASQIKTVSYMRILSSKKKGKERKKRKERNALL